MVPGLACLLAQQGGLCEGMRERSLSESSVDLPKTLGGCPSPCPSVLSTVWALNPTPAFLIFCLEMHLWPPSSWGVVVPKSNAETDARESSMLPAILQFSSSPVLHAAVRSS